MNVIIGYISQTRLTVKTSSVKFQWFNTAQVYFLVMLPYTGGAQRGWHRVSALCSYSGFFHPVALSFFWSSESSTKFSTSVQKAREKRTCSIQGRFHGPGLEKPSCHILLVRTQSYGCTKLECFDPVHRTLKMFKVYIYIYSYMSVFLGFLL